MTYYYPKDIYVFTEVIKHKYPIIESADLINGGAGTVYVVLGVRGQFRRLYVEPHLFGNHEYLTKLYESVDRIMLGFRHSLMLDVPNRKIIRRRATYIKVKP